VNPRGGLVYDLPITWKAGDTTNIQVTTNTTQCDASATGVALPFIVECAPRTIFYIRNRMTVTHQRRTSFWAEIQ
jgi:hypothetical protein